MSIVLASRLSSAERRLLGNNLCTPVRSKPGARHRRERRLVATLNRSLACVGERIERLTERAAVPVAMHP